MRLHLLGWARPRLAEREAIVLAGFFLIAIAAADLAADRDPDWGLALYFTVLFTFVLSWALWHRDSSRNLFLALSLAPIIRIATIALPLPEFDEAYRYLVRAVPVLAGVIGIARALDLGPGDIGLTMRASGLQLLVAACGFALGAVQYRILEPEPLIDSLTWQNAAGPALALLVGSGIAEEVALRGVVQTQAERIWPWGWILAAAISALVHFGGSTAEHSVFIFGAALFFGWTVKVTRSIVGVILAHGLMTASTFVIFPFVS